MSGTGHVPFVRRLRWIVWLVSVQMMLTGAWPTADAAQPSVDAAQHRAAAPVREIVVNIPAFRLTLYENGVPIREYPVGVGHVVKPSLLGSTEIINRVYDPTYYPPDWWKRGLQPIPPGPDNPVGTRWLGLGFPGYGIHGTNDPSSIGKAVSGGCIRMYNEDVEELARLVRIGTPVHLIYETIEVWRDDATGTHFLRVYPDIYRIGTNTIEEAQRRLAEFVTWQDFDPEPLAAQLAEAVRSATGIPVPLTFTPIAADTRIAAGAPMAAGTLIAADTPMVADEGPAAPEAAEMIESYGHVAFPKRAVGLIGEEVVRVLLGVVVNAAGLVQSVQVVQSSGYAFLDDHARRVAESAIRYKAFDRGYQMSLAVGYVSSGSSSSRLVYEPAGRIELLDPPASISATDRLSRAHAAEEG